MRFLVLGRGKMGKLVADVATERGHSVRSLTERENVNGSALTPPFLILFDLVLDFTTPDVVLSNVRACLGAGAKMVVGTTGWYDQLGDVKALVERRDGALLYAANFSRGVQTLFSLAPGFAAAFPAHSGYTLEVHETHHTEKLDAPSGTAIQLKEILEATGAAAKVFSHREGQVIGVHSIVARGADDELTLAHTAGSRRIFAEGAVHAAEWLADKTGLYDYRDVYQQIG